MTPHIFCSLRFISSPEQFLPLVDVEAYTTILETTSRTILTQTYLNPSISEAIPELRYTFPLYDGVSVVAFTCRIGDRTIIGQVKDRQRAKKDFKDAVVRGDKAALLEQLPSASDVFTTTVGNIPAGAEVVVEITYIGELKHDAEVNGVRFTIPTSIMPRYGSLPIEFSANSAISRERRLQVTVDVILAQMNVIQSIHSPSHPITVSLGTVSFAPNAHAVMSKASATLSLGNAALDKDFIIQVVSKDTGAPTAVLETHPRIPNQRALLTTLVPKFGLPAERPEVVFICDCSGSMSGSNINLVKSALKVFLKSLPVGIKFNLCYFGSSYSFLWPKSATYSQSTLDQAVKHVESISADMGGTEMFEPIKEVLERRYKDIPLAVMLLTDGEVWDQESLFLYLNKEIIEAKAPIRVFTLGVGNGVSHALIEGVAKAGNGFSQSVGEGEKMEGKVVRMLKGALTPHVLDYTMEVKYTTTEVMDKDMDDDDFEIIERDIDSLNVVVNLADETKAESETVPIEKTPISLFDPSIDLELERKGLAGTPKDIDTGDAMFASLPTVTPKLLQTPHIIPPLYNFSRTNVYLLMGQQCSSLTPKSVVLRGVYRHTPLEIEIPIQVLDTPGETIHQLAAKSAIAELEQGRGWITELKDESDGQLFRLKYESRFADMVEREAVRLGVQFQVGGKWCSFVATEIHKANGEETVSVDWKEEEEGGIKDVVITKEIGVLTQPAVSKGSSWFRRPATGTGSATTGALTQVDGVWKRNVQVLVTRKAHVDKVCPLAKTSNVYYDDEVYDAVLTDKSTGVTNVTQLLYDTSKSAYYVYNRCGEIDHRLAGPHETIEAAKSAFQETYRDKFGVEWTERETAVSDVWSYQVKTYEAFEETEEIEEVVDESEITCEVVREEVVADKEKEVEGETHTSTTTTSEEVVLEHTTKEVIAVDEAKEIVVTKESGVVTKPAVSNGSSWFRRLASGAGAAACGALTQVDGVWKRTVQVLTTRMAHVDSLCPIAKTSYVYYDEDVYDALLTEKSTGVIYVTQLLYSSEDHVYYVYVRWGETDYKMDGPHTTINAAKDAFQATYQDYFGVQWAERERAVNGKAKKILLSNCGIRLFGLFDSKVFFRSILFSLPADAWSFEVKTYETFEETEEIEEVVGETDTSTEEVAEDSGLHAVCTHQRQIVAADEKMAEGINTMIRQDEALMDLQTFEGFWEWQESLFSWIEMDPKLATEVVKKHGWDFRIAATAFVIVFFKEKQAKEKDTWELVVEKAKGWMEEQIGVHEVAVVLRKVAELVN